MDDASTRHVIPEAPSSFNVCMYCSCSMDHDLDLDLAPAQIDKHGFFNRSRIPACVSASSSQQNPDQLSSAVTRNIQLTKLTRYRYTTMFMRMRMHSKVEKLSPGHLSRAQLGLFGKYQDGQKSLRCLSCATTTPQQSDGRGQRGLHAIGFPGLKGLAGGDDSDGR